MGIYIEHFVAGGVAERDGRLRVKDRVRVGCVGMPYCDEYMYVQQCV